VQVGEVVPADLRDFYAACGGADLFIDQPFGIHLRGPDQLVPSNPLVVGVQIAEDRSSSWYAVANDFGGEVISIDLHPARLGRCYDSFSDRHGVAGSCAVVAESFSELVEHLMRARGRHWWWLEPEFKSLGDAYDR
jgi:hypothetical protein